MELCPQAEVQKKADLLKSISDKIGSPGAEATAPTATPKITDIAGKCPTPIKAPVKKRRREKVDPVTTDVSVARNCVSKKFVTAMYYAAIEMFHHSC